MFWSYELKLKIWMSGPNYCWCDPNQYAEIVEEALETSNNNSNGNPFPVGVQPTTNFSNNNNDRKVPIHLTKNKIAYLVYPTDINEKDIKLFEHAIQGILLRLHLENEEESLTERNGDSQTIPT